MDIRITARAGDVRAGMKEKAQQKLTKLTRYYDRITWIDMILDEEHEKKTVEVSAGLTRGATVVGKATNADMFAAIDLALDKISRQLRKHKEKLSDHRGFRPEPPAGPKPGGPVEPTFEDAVRELNED